MKRSLPLLISFFVSPVSFAETPEWVLSDSRPLTTLNFRYAEGSLRTQQTTPWLKRWGNADGIILKALDEEVRPFGKDAWRTLSEYSDTYPDKLMLMHVNGRSRLPTFAPDKMKASDYLYLLGTPNESEISLDEDESRIRVSNIRAFKRNRSIPDGVFDDVVLVKRNRDGTLNWDIYEHAKLIDVDPTTQSITVKRDLLGEGKKAFESGEAYIALHASKGPFDKTVKQRLWEYNWFYAGVTANSELGLSSRLGKEFGNYLLSEVNFFDGITLDVLTEFHQPKIGGYPGPIDVDQDGKPDEDEGNYDNLHRKGVYAFLHELRETVDVDKLILADGGYIHQKALHLLNGMESEGWPNNRDPELKHWSSGLNRYEFWSTFAQKPRLNYVKLAEYWSEDRKNRKRITPSDNIRRLTVAAAFITDTVIVPSHRPRGIHYQKWPEFKQLKALGEPISELHHLAFPTSKVKNRVLEDHSGRQLSFPSLNFRNDKVTADKCYSLNQTNGPLTISLRAAKDDSQFVSTLVVKPNNDEPRYSLVNHDKSFTSWFYWDESTSDEVCFASSDGMSLELSDVMFYQGAMVSYREYENGLVVTNPYNENIDLEFSDLSLKNSYKDNNLNVESRDIVIQLRK